MNPWVILGIAAAILLLVGGRTLAGEKNPYHDLFQKVSAKWKVPERLLYAISKKESSFDPLALNLEAAADKKRGRNVDSVGLFQILYPDTAQAYRAGVSREALFLEEVNADIAGNLLKDLLHRYPQTYEDGFPASAVAAYNAGSPKYILPSRFVNQEYVDDVHTFWKEFNG